MAIKKDDVLAQVAQEVVSFCDEAETVIDSKLKFFTKGSSVTVRCSEINLSPGIVGYEQIKFELIRRYNEAGWNVDYDYDQRDGSWFTFS